jgi:glycine/D-amino acid oxidase-like deaminating enzyme
MFLVRCLLFEVTHPMPPFIREPARRTPVSGRFDVVVVGGGIAGVAAAVAAARTGASVGLVEKSCVLGGLATLGIVTVYLPLCDGAGRKVVGGLGEELLKLSVADGSAEIPACWRRGGGKAARRTQRYCVRFNPASYLLALEGMAHRSGVRILYDTVFCGLARRRRGISAAIVENKSGRSALACGAVVDATGDADVCAAAGEPTVSLRTNVACGWFYTLDGAGHAELKPFTLPFDQDGLGVPPGGGRGFAGDNADDVTGQVIQSRKAILRELGRMRKRAGQAKCFPFMVRGMPTFRMTRRLDKPGGLSAADDRRCLPDAIGMVGSWLDDGRVFYLPFSALTAARTRNLLVAGRCIAVAADAWKYTRVIPACAVSGQAAGLAAALVAGKPAGDVATVNVGDLQKRLLARKVIIDRRLARGAE